MKSIHDEQLQALYRSATRGLPNHADHRVTPDELLALASGSSLGVRHSNAVTGIALSADQSAVLRVLNDTQALALDLVTDLRDLGRPTFIEAVRNWWRSVGMPPVFASAGIALMAVIGFQFVGSATLPLPQSAQAPAAQRVEMPMFGGAFEAPDQMFAASLETSEQTDQMFTGDFDS